MELFLCGQPVPVKSNAKFPGLVLDKKLAYKEHLKQLRDKCFISLNILKCVARTSYGPDRQILLMLCRSLIRPKPDYASFVCDSVSLSNKKTLDTVHYTALRTVTGAFRTSPVDSLLVETNEPPLFLRRQRLGMRCAMKL